MHVRAILHVSWWQLWQWLSMIMMMGKKSHSLQASTHAFNLLAVTPRGEALACKPRLGQLSEIWELGNFCLMITLQVNCSNTNKNPHHHTNFAVYLWITSEWESWWEMGQSFSLWSLILGGAIAWASLGWVTIGWSVAHNQEGKPSHPHLSNQRLSIISLW